MLTPPDAMPLCSPMPLAAVPGIKLVGQDFVGQPRELACAGQRRQPAQPDLTRRPPPYRDSAVSTCVKPAFGIDAMKTSAYVFNAGAEPSQRIRLEIDIAKFDGTRTDRTQQPIALPVDAGIADRALRVVPDGEF